MINISKLKKGETFVTILDSGEVGKQVYVYSGFSKTHKAYECIKISGAKPTTVFYSEFKLVKKVNIKRK